MKRVIYAIVALIFLTGCALSTIRPPKKSATSRQEPVVERRVYAPKPAPKMVVVEKEEVLPTKEEILPLEEEIK